MGTELRLSQTKIFYILGCFYVHFLLTQSSSLWHLFTTVEGKHGYSCWLCMIRECDLLTGGCALSVPMFWNAEWEILRVHSLFLCRIKDPSVSTKIISLGSSIWSACHCCIELPHHRVWMIGSIRSSVKAVTQIFMASTKI